MLFATVAVNVCVCPPYRVIVLGVTLTETGGDSVIVAVPVAEVFAWLVAVTVTVCDVVILAIAIGAVLC